MPRSLRKDSARIVACALAACAAITGPAPPASGQLPSDIADLLMYACNNDDPRKLLRVSWGSGEIMVIGEVMDGATPLQELEAFVHIPYGPSKGFYSAENYDNNDERSRLTRIDPLTAQATMYPLETGYGYVIGMIPFRRPGTDDWVILATHRGEINGSGPKRANLIIIDPAGDGRGEVVMELEHTYEGLARLADGTLVAVRRRRVNSGPWPDAWGSSIWQITPDFGDPTGGTEVQRGPEIPGRVEALEFIAGEAVNMVQVPGVHPDWTAEGLLIGFNDSNNEYLIYNSDLAHPKFGEPVAFVPPFEDGTVTTDAEGIVFYFRDPYGGVYEGWD